MLKLIVTTSFKKEVKKIKNEKDKMELKKVLDILLENKALPSKYRSHQLTGNYKKYMECHVKPDLLLIYKIEKKELCLYVVHIGSHAELFGK